MLEQARFALRLPQEIYAALQDLAARDRRSVNGEIVYIIERFIAEERRADGDGGEEAAPGKMMAAA